ncbi:MAG: ECF-type sigma factor [Acidobacteriota bacterium]|nr:ECF-type sigma factor [Acidobacteriota bacterium]
MTLLAKATIDLIFSLVYEDLRRLASYVHYGDQHQTLNTTSLVHEAWFKLKDSPRLVDLPLSHFKSIAMRAMRQVLVEEARRRSAQKRDAGDAPLFPAIGGSGACSEQFLALDLALNELAQASPRQAEIVNRRFFGGETIEETALALGVSESMVEREWRAAKAWLAIKMRGMKG